MRFRIKIVPKASPNSDGEWIEVEADREPESWADMMELFEAQRETHFIVMYDRVG